MSKPPISVLVPSTTVKNLCSNIATAEGQWDVKSYGAVAKEARETFHSMIKSAPGAIKFHWALNATNDLEINRIEGVDAKYEKSLHSFYTVGR